MHESFVHSPSPSVLKFHGLTMQDRPSSSSSTASLGSLFFESLLLRPDPQAAEPSSKGMALHKLLSKGVKDTVLLQVQAGMVSVWLDHVQRSQDAEKLLDCIPDRLWKPEILRTRNRGAWC